jgi:type I site-specific restriction-modification system R (restriction) subunit
MRPAEAVIVRDSMWLTVPCCHTMYVDKAHEETHNLMQAIARA